MNTIEQEVYDFMENHLGIYDNPHDIEIAMDSNSISLESRWPGQDAKGDMYVGLWFESETIAEFIQIFGITSVACMNTITPFVMLNLYQKGLTEIYCCIDTSLTFYSLYFNKQNDMVLAKNDEGLMNEVTEDLETPEQFMQYTLNHFRTAGMPGYYSPVNLS